MERLKGRVTVSDSSRMTVSFGLFTETQHHWKSLILWSRGGLIPLFWLRDIDFLFFAFCNLFFATLLKALSLLLKSDNVARTLAA